MEINNIVAQYAAAVMQGCVRLRNAMKRILEAVVTMIVNRTADLKASEQYL